MFMKRNEKLPSGVLFVSVAALALSVLIILYTFSNGISGNDFWWHVKVGQWVVDHNRIPTVDVFSWYSTGHQIPWVAHEWLSDVIFYYVHNWFGALGIFFMSLGAALGMLALLWRQAGIHKQKNILMSSVFIVLFSLSTSVFFYGRPHLISFFLLFFELKLLYDFFEDSSRKGIYFIPVIACLWSNVHGGSSNLSYLLCVAFLVAGICNIKIGRMEACPIEKKAAIKLAVVTVLSVAAILINPVGIKMLFYPYQNMGDDLMLMVISEWGAPDAKDIGELLLFYCPVILMLIGFFAEEKKIRLVDMGIMFVFIFLFLRSVRFIMLWYIAASFCAFRYLPECKIKPFSRKTELILSIVCVVVLALPVASVVQNVQTALEEEQLITTVLSDEAVEAVEADGPERIFNDYNLGEALIYHDLPVFFDARADVYAYENLLADGVSLMLLSQLNGEADTTYVDVDALIRKYDFDAMLILKNRPLYAYLLSHPERFVSIYEDEQVGYFSVIDPQKSGKEG